MLTDPDRRHLDAAGFERAIAEAVPLEFPVDGSPSAAIFIDTATPAVGLRLPADGTRPAPNLEHLDVRFVYRDQAAWVEVLITQPDLFHDGYPLLCAIADRVQIRRMTVATAVADAVKVLGRLLERNSHMSVDTEIGLLGELLTLHALMERVGVERAVRAWCGPDAEEHDFALPGVDLEVKTTRSERRTHWISSLGQLANKPDRLLWLVSFQVTGAGAAAGLSLPNLVRDARSRLGATDDTELRDLLDNRLHCAGWADAAGCRLCTRWLVRSAPVAYLVHDEFPVISHEALDAAGVATTHIQDVRYRIDLTDVIPTACVPYGLAAALKTAIALLTSEA